MMQYRHVRGNKKPRVIVADFDSPLYDVTRFRPAAFRQHPTVYEMLNIRDPVVANTLFDQRKIETVLLLPNREVGRAIIERQSTQACHEAFLPNGDRLLGMPTFRSYGCGEQRARFLVQDTQSLIEPKLREIRTLKESLATARRELEDASKQMASKRQARSQLERQLESIRKQLFTCGQKLKDTERIVIPEPADLAVYEEEIETYEKEIGELEVSIAQLEASSSGVREAFEAATAANERHKAESNECVEHYDRVRSDYSKIQQDVNSQCEATEHYKKSLAEVIDKERQLDKELYDNQIVLDVCDMI